jgi:hypothetical protein
MISCRRYVYSFERAEFEGTVLKPCQISHIGIWLQHFIGYFSDMERELFFVKKKDKVIPVTGREGP